MLALLLIAAAHADDLSFAPWSGASLAFGNDGGSATAALASPLARSNAALDLRAEVPWTGSGFGVGDYSLQLGFHITSVKQLAEAISPRPKLAEMEHGDTEICVLGAITANDSKDWGTLVKATEEGVAANLATWTARAQKPIDGCPDAAVTEQARRRMAEALGAYEDNLAAQRLIDATDASPFDELAGRKITRAVWSLAPAGELGWAATETDPSGPVDGEFGLSAALYTPDGFAFNLAGGPTWGGATQAAGGFAEGHVAWVSPAFVRPDVAASEDKKGAYFVAELGAIQQFDDALDGQARLLLGFRPSAGGAGVLGGVSLPWTSAGTGTPLPTLSISAELPSLGSK